MRRKIYSCISTHKVCVTTCLLLLFVSSGRARKFPYLASFEWQMQSRCCNAGGSPYATIAILDMMDAIKCDISTVAFGMCASTATLLLVSVTAFVTKRALPQKRPHMYVACMLTSLRILQHAALSLLLSTWCFANHLNICDACRLQELRAKDMPCLVLVSWCISLQVSYMMLLLMMQLPKRLLLPCQQQMHTADDICWLCLVWTVLDCAV